MKRLLLFFFCFPAFIHAQLCFDFESGSLENWKQSRDSAWAISDQDALCGSFSLWHRLDDSISGKDRIFFAYDSLITDSSATSWSFIVRHGYNPSSSNNWTVYLLSECDESGMNPGAENRAIILGVNYKGSDDLLKLWFVDGDKADVLAETSLNWQEDHGTSMAGLRIDRKADGEWIVYIAEPEAGSGYGSDGLIGMVGDCLDETALAFKWKMIGSGKETKLVGPMFFGIHYRFSSKQDRKFWFDNFCINGTFRRDTTPLVISSLDVRSETILRIFFSESPDMKTALSPGNYTLLSGDIQPESIVQVSETAVDLFFGQAFVSGQAQILRTEGIVDRKGNVSGTLEDEFIWYKPHPGDVIFNEIMYDPLPEIGLPGYEYIELFNGSGYTISMDGWSVKMGNKIKGVGDYSLPGGECLLLCYKEMKDYYPGADHVVDILSSMTMLSNEGALLQLLDADSILIDWMEYTVDMHSNEYFAEGGWSLERIDPGRTCHSPDNWSTSTSRLGGSPGKENSLLGKKPDRLPPVIGSVYLLDAQNLILEFNESLDPETATCKENWFVNNGMGNPDSISLRRPWNRELTLQYNKGFTPGKEYCLEPGREIKDCSGNRLYSGCKIQLALPVLPTISEILISEVLFNPLPFCPDFIEIYNPTQKTFDLADLCLANQDPESGEIVFAGRVITGHRLFFPHMYLALTRDPDELNAFFLVHDPESLVKVQNMAVMGDIEGTVFLLDKYLNVLDKMTYHKEMQHKTLSSPEGVALERISFTMDSENRSNWHSASSTEGYGTPGKKNSQHRSTDPENTGITIEPEIFTPDMDGVEDVLMIKYRFLSPGCRARIMVFDPRGRLIREIARGELLGTEGFYTWDGTDRYGKRAGTGIYLVFTEVSGVDGKIRKFRNTCVLSVPR